MGTHHKIEIKLVDDHAVPLMPDAMQVGDTISFFSRHKRFRVEIEHGSPFDDPTIHRVSDSDGRKLRNRGRFFCKCFITPDGSNQEVGWREGEIPESGGDCNVMPNKPGP